MSWSEKSVMEKKFDFIKDYETGNYSIAELSRRYSISRKTAYKYIDRYKAEGEKGLEERSRAPHNRTNTTSEEIIDEIIACKTKHSSWGPKKIIARLSKDNPDKSYPSPGTAHHWLKAYDLVRSRRRIPKTPPYTQPFSECNASNDIWSVDYKGQFRMDNRQYCYPLTLEDNHSRYLLLCMGLRNTNYEDARKWLEYAFREYGLPKSIRSDNGPPFASTGRSGLTQLSAWFIQLGIQHERIDKGHPEQNGRLERFHRTLKDYIKEHPQANMGNQQKLFGSFRYEYNHVRPHEAIEFKTPSELYIPSNRQYHAKIRPPEYGPDLQVRKIGTLGKISLEWKTYFISTVLRGEYVGIRVMNNGSIEVYYYDRKILILDDQQGTLSPSNKRKYAARLERQIKHQPWKKKLHKKNLDAGKDS